MGVAAHEASNLRVFEGQAVRNDQEIVAKSIEVQFGYNAQTGRLEVVGGRSRVSFKDKENGPGGAANAASAENAAGTDDAKEGKDAKGAKKGLAAASPSGPEDARSEGEQELALLSDLATELKGQLNSLNQKQQTEEAQGERDKADRLRDKKATLMQQIEDVERKRKELEAQKREADMAKQLEAVNETVGQAISDSTNAALGLAKGAASAKRGGSAQEDDDLYEQFRKNT
ncbi:MAG: hypothetical protein FJZ00_09020, partial [Candidatus Sericytochromatia bacterium]|nr:hypothetical protein [Candidatus Tanganyikabacteria bacterium]